MNKRGEVGKKAEEIASRYLERKGYRIIERNYRTKGGEIDLVARDGAILVFVEIRSRSHASPLLNPILSIGPQKKHRIERVALHYLTEKKLYGKVDCRFDVIGISLDGDRSEIEFLKDAFRV